MAIELLLALLALSALTIGVIKLIIYLFPRSSCSSKAARAVHAPAPKRYARTTDREQRWH